MTDEIIKGLEELLAAARSGDLTTVAVTARINRNGVVRVLLCHGDPAILSGELDAMRARAREILLREMSKE